MDDISFSDTIMTAVGLESDEESATDEKVSQSRLGSTNFFSSQGPTLLLGSFVFILIIIGIILAIIIVKRRGASQKCQNRLSSIKKKIFFNPIVRYMILNCLKLSISALVAFKA